MKNEYLLKKAMELIPDLNRTEVNTVGTVLIEKNETGVSTRPDEDYRTRTLKTGDKVILDFGDHQVGYLTLKLNYAGGHPDAPAWLRFQFAERPEEFLEDTKGYKGWISSSWIEVEEVHVDIIPSTYELNRRYAFRYVQIEAIDISPQYSLIVEDAVCTAVSSVKDEDLLPYHSEDERKLQLDRIAVRTLHNCMQKVFEDGPKRDRRLWIGDLRIQALVNYQTYQKNDLVKACLYLFGALPLKTGQTGTAIFLEPEPEVDDGTDRGQEPFLDYTLFFVSVLYDYYMETKDMETLTDLWPIAAKQVEFARKRVGENGLLKDGDSFGWCFVDWNIQLNKQASAQGILMYTLQQAIELAEILNAEQEKDFRDLYQQLYTAANTLLWDQEQECYLSGKEKQLSIASQAWLVLGGAIEGPEALKLLSEIEKREGVQGMVSPYMYHNLVDALIKVGAKDLALEKMMSYWGGMADLGADTFFELYNPKNPAESPYGGTIVNSYCHAWSCGPAYFLRKYYQE